MTAAGRALILTPEYPPFLHGGLGTHVGELARGLVRAGWAVDVLLADLLDAPPPEVAGEHDGVVVHLVPRVGKSRMRDVSAAAEATIAAARPDVVHAHDAFFVPAALALRRSRGIPVVATAHLLEEAIAARIGARQQAGRREMERLLCTSVDRLIVVSESMRELAAAAYGADAARTRVVHNGFSAAAFVAPPFAADAREAFRASFGAEDERLVLFAGRLAPQKGLDGLLDTAVRLAAASPPVRVVLAGEALDDAYRARFEARAEAASGVARLTRLGKLARAELARHYRAVDAAVVPSLSEPFGYAALEAMASEVPLVASAVGGLAEIVEHERSGLLVPTIAGGEGPDRVDDEALAAALLRVLDDRALAARLAAGGRARAAEFTIEAMVDGTAAVYREAIAAAAGG